MEEYLRDIKNVVDSVASIQTSIPNVVLNNFTIDGLGLDYDRLVTD